MKWRNTEVPMLCLYRPPSATENYNQKIRETVKEVCNQGTRQVLICGDLNYGGINWEKGEATGSAAREFLNVCLDSFLHQHVREVTRSRGNVRPSLLDLILTKNDLDTEDLRYEPPVGKSDHCVLNFKFSVDGGESAISQDKSSRLNYHKGNYAKAVSMFAAIKWESELVGKDVEDMWSTFSCLYQMVVRQCVPLYVVCKGKRKKKWMNKCLHQMIQRKEEAWKRHRRNMKSKTLLKKYQDIRNKVTSAVRRAKHEYEHKLAKEVK